MRLPRKKPRNLLASVLYRLKPPIPLNALLDLAAIFHRLAFEKAVARGFDVWRENAFLHRHIKPTDRVLEIGCSSGRVLSQVQAAERVGVDLDLGAIERGRKDGLTLIHADARDYLKRADAFGVLILSHVLEHIDGPEEFLSSLSFDRIYIEVPDFDADALNGVRMERGTIAYTDEDHVAEFGRDELEAMLKTAGLKVIDSEFRYGFMRYWVGR